MPQLTGRHVSYTLMGTHKEKLAEGYITALEGEQAGAHPTCRSAPP
ncbi:MAG: hypothetical protein ACRDYY_09155 [Acidimicrobiales bacterium]